MIKPNKNKLIPCADVAWGDIKGSISMQSDLISLLSDYATESWVSEQGFMTSESLSGYATESWVESQEYITSEALVGYATESWVSEQGFLSEVPSDYATKNWVNNKNFATKSWVSSNFLSEVPSQYATQSWVINKNYASKSWVSSNFLSEVPSEYATKSWVESNGYLSEIPSEYATKEWVSNKDYASKVWVYEQKYLKKVPSEYATQSWVSQTLSSYATESWVISTLSSFTPDLSSYATKSWVEDKGYITSSALSGYATESWVESQNYVSAGNPNLVPLFSRSEGYLKYEPAEVLLSGSTNEQQIVESANNANIFRLVTTIGNDVYFYDIVTMHMFKFNFVSFEFDDLGLMNNATSSQVPLWADSQGRMYYGNQYKVDLENNEFISADLGGDVQIHTGSGKSNLVQRDGVTYLISKNNSCAYIFNEETQLFDSSIPITNSFPNNNYYRYLSEFEGHWIYDAGSTQTELVFHLDVAEPYVEWVTLENRLFPGAWTYEYEGQTINETTRGVFIHPVVKNGVRDWYTFGYANKVMYKLVDGAWEIVDYNQEVTGLVTNAGGCACGTLWFGFGYTSPSTNNGIIIWNLDTNDYGIPEVYGWEQIDLSGYVREDNLKTINGESIVGSGDIEVGGLTPEQEDAVEVLTNSSKGVLYTDQIDPYIVLMRLNSHIYEPWGLYQVDDDVYYLYNQELSKFNKDILNFDYITRLDSSANQPLWRDATGRLYDGTYMIDIPNQTEVYVDMNANLYENNGKNNILYGQYGIWSVDQYNLQKFDESTQKFIGGYTVNVPVGYQDNLQYYMTLSFKYDGHILYDNGTSTYEIVDYEDHIDVVDVTNIYYTRPSFSINSNKIFGTDSGLFYMQDYDYYRYNPENNEWDRISISGDDTYFSYRYVVTGDFLLGGFYFTGGEYCVTNLGNTWKKTSWTDVKNVAVDLSSQQNIKGYKNFKGGLQTSTLTIGGTQYGDGWIRFGQNNSKIEALKDLNISVPGLCTLNDKEIAVTDQCILNRSYTYPGSRFEGVAGFNGMFAHYIYYFVTPSGRLIYSDSSNQVAYEFDGTQWVQLQSVTTFVSGEWRAELNDGLYVVNSNDSSLYRWDDTNSDWVFIINMPEQNIWAADANTLRCGSAYKLVNNGGTYEWDTNDPTLSYEYQKSFKVGQTYYVNSSGVYTYDESVKYFTSIGNIQYADGNHWFTYNGCLYYFYGGFIRKVDPSQVGTEQWDVQTDIFYSTWDTAYVVYDSKIWTVVNYSGYNKLGYTYNLTESLPAVPNTNGTYVLKAVRTNAGVTYSWVEDVDAQAIQITNQILG